MAQFASIPSPDCIRARTGTFVISPARTLALRPDVTSELRITCGKAWVTVGDGVDHFLHAGQSLRAAKGSHVVIEPMRWPGHSGDIESVYLDWDPVPMRIPRAAAPIAANAPSRPAPQRMAVGQAWGDFRAAFAAGCLAAARLAVALLGLALPTAWRATAGLRGALAARARKAHSSANRAQGRMASCESIASSGAV